MNQFGKLAEKIGILVQGGTVNVGQIRLDSEMSRQELRNRKALLNNVRNAWVEGVLEKSLHEQIPIVLGLENRPSAVASPWNLDLINPDRSCQPLPAGTPVIDVFDKLGEGGTLLILGEPGSGKTITLLQLARDLIARAEQEIDRRIPVVLNLSSWAAEKQTIAKWIVEELNSKYQVNRKIGQQWVEKQELLLLLDGLDEIRDLEKRNACVTALNAFQQEQATEIVVCCRVRDYEKLGHQLKLQSAIVLQPLTIEQIHTYLDCLQSNLTVLKTLLVEDVMLQELAQSPLLINIMVFAYQGIEFADMPVSTIALNRKKQLFDDYIDRIFQSSRLVAYRLNSQSQEKYIYSRQNVTRWLLWTSQQMVRHSQTIFLIEKIQPYWINRSEIIFYRIGIILIFGLIFGLPFGVIYFLSCDLIYGLKLSVSDKLSGGINIGLISWLGFVGLSSELIGQMQIKLVESVTWSFRVFNKEYLSFMMITGLISVLIVGLISMQSFGLSYGLIFGLSYGLIGGLIVVLIGGLSVSDVEIKVYTNQGIKKSAKNALVFGFVSGLISGLISWLIFGLTGLFDRKLSGLIGGLIGGLSSMLNLGGLTCIQHFILRLLLYFKGCIPWNYAKFLDWASDKLFLQKVGGGYIFIHRSLMEHFAEMENG